ncbi:MAG TPA: DUF2804 domain-containing protein [Acidimicrobiales bacterium]|nr:DUF2804 domain-containing protein [Acidimicrobiales bacterium]
MSATLPAAPASVVDGDGTAAYGTYLGRTRPGVERLAVGLRRLRLKRWHYVSIASPDVLAAVAVVDVGWAQSAFAYLFDRTSGRMVADVSSLRPLRRSAVTGFPVDGAVATLSTRRLFARLAGTAGRWQLAVRSPELVLEAELTESALAPTVCAVARVGTGVDCTHKTPCLAVTGVATCGSRRFVLDGAVGALDHTAGVLPRTTVWRWASAAGPDVALNLTEQFTAPAENVLWHDGGVSRLSPVRFSFDPRRPLEPWRIASDDGTVALEFVPEGLRRQDTNLVVAASRYVQPVGRFRGTAAGVAIEDLPGVTEDHLARW